MMPPQVRPTENASSALARSPCSPAARSDRPASASSYTAPSTQPPDTEPTAVPSGPTSIEAPGGRGADWKVATPVPTPTVAPDRHQASSSGSTSRTRDHLRQLGEGRQRVAGDEVVAVRQRGEHALLHRLVAGLAAVRVDPHDAVRDPLQPGHLLAEQGRVAALPAVAEDDDHRAAGHPTLAPPVEEEPQRLAEAGAAGPVRHGLAGGDQRPLGVADPH